MLPRRKPGCQNDPEAMPRHLLETRTRPGLFLTRHLAATRGRGSGSRAAGTSPDKPRQPSAGPGAVGNDS